MTCAKSLRYAEGGEGVGEEDEGVGRGEWTRGYWQVSLKIVAKDDGHWPLGLPPQNDRQAI